MHNLFAMGGYGIYVWSAYGITLFVFAFNFLGSLRERKSVKKIIKHYLKLQPKTYES